jgi:hypothetical protein
MQNFVALPQPRSLPLPVHCQDAAGKQPGRKAMVRFSAELRLASVWTVGLLSLYVGLFRNVMPFFDFVLKEGRECFGARRDRFGAHFL